MMGLGFENALSEITLVLFTTLAPSGIVACVIMMFVLFREKLADSERAAISKALSIPITVALVGLIASATHLGNPANALYVLTRVGSSPLSNEVCCGAVFFGLAGSYWFFSFSRVRRSALERVWIILTMLAGLVFLIAIALAYNVETIMTWSHPLVPVALILNALAGGPLLAIVGFAAASFFSQDAVGAKEAHLRRLMLVSLVSAIANLLIYIAIGVSVMPMTNSATSAGELVPYYLLMVGIFALMFALAFLIQWRALASDAKARLLLASVSALLALAGIFVMRFAFYMSHMTVGMSF